MTRRTVSSEAIKALDEVAHKPDGQQPFHKALIKGLRDVLASPAATEVDVFIMHSMAEGQPPLSLPLTALRSKVSRDAEFMNDTLGELWTIGTHGAVGTARGTARLTGIMNAWSNWIEISQGLFGVQESADVAASTLKRKIDSLNRLYHAQLRHDVILRRKGQLRQALAYQ